MWYFDSYILVQILTLTENVCGVKPAVELNYSFTDDPEYKKKVRICVLCNLHVNFVHRFPIQIFMVIRIYFTF